MNAVMLIAQKELRDAVQGRWLIAFAITFAAMAGVIALVQDGGDIGSQGFNRTTASMINLSLLLVPLLALLLGATAVAGERERGTLATLLSQPISTTEFMLGKVAGLNLALWLAVILGFGGAGMALALAGSVAGFGSYMAFVLLASVLATAMVSVGLAVSVLSDSRLKAIAIAVLLWFAFVLLYDLGAIGLAVALNPSGRSLFAAALINPVECVRILSVLSIEEDATVLGPLGSYLSDTLGKTGAITFLGAALAAWALIPAAIASWIFSEQDI